MSRRKARVGLSLFMILATVVTWMVYTTLRREVAGPTNTYSALFSDVSGLHPGDDVRVAGVRVGRVDAVELEGALAKVTFRVQEDQILFTNTTAAVTYQDIIGQRYLGLSKGESGSETPLSDHGQIPLERTEPSFDISNLLNGFEPLFTLLDPQQVDNITNAVILALQGDNGSVLMLVTQASELAQSLAGPDQILGQVITNLTAAIANLAAQSTGLQSVIRQTRDIMVSLESRHGSLVTAAKSITDTLGRLATVTEDVYPDLSELIARQPGLTGTLLGDAQPRFAYLGANLPYLLKGFARFTQEGSYSSAYFCDINAKFFAFLGRLIPAIVRHATPGGVIKQSPICR